MNRPRLKNSQLMTLRTAVVVYQTDLQGQGQVKICLDPDHNEIHQSPPGEEKNPQLGEWSDKWPKLHIKLKISVYCHTFPRV